MYRTLIVNHGHLMIRLSSQKNTNNLEAEDGEEEEVGEAGEGDVAVLQEVL